ncbi:MAG: hypothetical protein C0425_00925 [Chlorobiaceae bacterium]|nr:hypothetical protein [Chlorobiaceae bacterium]MBA4308885.1 hypothetical protein [Chlorobiaceae bacterium]
MGPAIERDKLRLAGGQKGSGLGGIPLFLCEIKLWRVCQAVAELASLLGVIPKKVRTSIKKHRIMLFPTHITIFSYIFDRQF